MQYSFPLEMLKYNLKICIEEVGIHSLDCTQRVEFQFAIIPHMENRWIHDDGSAPSRKFGSIWNLLWSQNFWFLVVKSSLLAGSLQANIASKQCPVTR